MIAGNTQKLCVDVMLFQYINYCLGIFADGTEAGDWAVGFLLAQQHKACARFCHGTVVRYPFREFLIPERA